MQELVAAGRHAGVSWEPERCHSRNSSESLPAGRPVWRAGSWYDAESKVACRRGSGTRNTHITRNLLKRLLLFSIRFLPPTSCTSSYSALHCSYLFGKPQIPMSVGSRFLS